MEWSWRWAFWSRDESKQAHREGRVARPRREPARIEEWEAELVEHGVTAEWAPKLAERLQPLHKDLGPGSAAPIIRTAAVAVEVQADAHAQVERNLKDVREVERLLGAFSGELEKLDEVLEVLSAYAQRMRAKPARKPKHTLH